MDHDEIEKCKNDIVYFTEKMYGIKLTKWQKTILKLHKKGCSFHVGRLNGRRLLNDSLARYEKFIK